MSVSNSATLTALATVGRPYDDRAHVVDEGPIPPGQASHGHDVQPGCDPDPHWHRAAAHVANGTGAPRACLTSPPCRPSPPSSRIWTWRER